MWKDNVYVYVDRHYLLAVNGISMIGSICLWKNQSSNTYKYLVISILIILLAISVYYFGWYLRLLASIIAISGIFLFLFPQKCSANIAGTFSIIIAIIYSGLSFYYDVNAPYQRLFNNKIEASASENEEKILINIFEEKKNIYIYNMDSYHHYYSLFGEKHQYYPRLLFDWDEKNNIEHLGTKIRELLSLGEPALVLIKKDELNKLNQHHKIIYNGNIYSIITFIE